VSASLRKDIDLTTARRDRGWSKAKAARETGVGNATWSRAESHLPISESSAKAISDVFGFTVTSAFPEPLDSSRAAAV